MVVAHLMGVRADGAARQPTDLLVNFPDHEVWHLTAEETRSAAETKGHRLGLMHDPTPTEPGHANIIWPPTSDLGRSAVRKVQRILADRARRLVVLDLDSGDS